MAEQHTCGTRQPPPCLACTIVGAQQRYVQQWQDKHRLEVYGRTWTCPLCMRVLQAIIDDRQLAGDVERHTTMLHGGGDWAAYMNAALDGDDAARDGGG